MYTHFSEAERAERRLKIHRVLLVFALVLILITISTVAFHIIEGWSWFQSFYVTLMTISTIGGDPENELSVPGRVFNVFVMLAGLGVVGFAIGSFTHAVIESEFGSFFGRRKMKSEITKLKNHFIICGAGRVGRRISLELSTRNLPFVMIEKDVAKLAWAHDHNFLTILGDATSEPVLSEAGIESAKGLASVVGSDAQNVYIVLTARGMVAELPIVTRASEETAESKLLKAGATFVISPYAFTGQRLARLLTRPKLQRFIEQTFTALTDESLDLQIEEVTITGNSPLQGITLADADARFQLGVIVLAMRRKGGDFKFHPKRSEVVAAGDGLIALGTSVELVGLKRLAASAPASS
jgi:voltage-gated potassium channel